MFRLLHTTIILCGLNLLSGCQFMYAVGLSVTCAGRPALVMEPEKWPDARVGELYKVLLTVKNSETPVAHVSVKEEFLPSGLRLIHKEGEDTFIIAGVPEQMGEFTFKLLMSSYGTQCAGQTGEQTVHLIVNMDSD